MGRQALNRVQGVTGLEPAETLLAACFAMGRTALTMGSVSGGRYWKRKADSVADDLQGGGMASALGKHNGILALTDRRLLWCEVKTALFKPKDVDAAFGLQDVRELAYEGDILSVGFRDGSTAAIYVAKGERPDEMIDAFRVRRSPEPPVLGEPTAPPDPAGRPPA